MRIACVMMQKDETILFDSWFFIMPICWVPRI